MKVRMAILLGMVFISVSLLKAENNPTTYWYCITVQEDSGRTLTKYYGSSGLNSDGINKTINENNFILLKNVLIEDQPGNNYQLKPIYSINTYLDGSILINSNKINSILPLNSIPSTNINIHEKTGYSYPTYEKPKYKNTYYDMSFVPGFSIATYYFLNQKNNYFGGDFHFDLNYTIETKNQLDDKQRRQLGRTEYYFECGLYKNSDENNKTDMFYTYTFGFNISFELSKSLKRTSLVPYYGCKIGGIYINQKGNGLLITPLIGLSLVNTAKTTFNTDISLVLNSIDFYNLLSLNPRIYFNIHF